jgi:hypothetical protein
MGSDVLCFELFQNVLSGHDWLLFLSRFDFKRSTAEHGRDVFRDF